MSRTKVISLTYSSDIIAHKMFLAICVDDVVDIFVGETNPDRQTYVDAKTLYPLVDEYKVSITRIDERITFQWDKGLGEFTYETYDGPYPYLQEYFSFTPQTWMEWVEFIKEINNVE